MRAAWLDPRLEVRESALNGRGTFALAAIPAGDVVTIWPHRILPADEEAPPGDVWPRFDGTRIWVPADDPTAPEAFLNHSCDPTVWLADEVTLEARRAIARAQELTIDYALFEL
ncbi:MAG TPA: SET domain-containing protein-lysine N-methyltransferase, partial [Burkholderiales bacterium]|nr:SET domain-containing protein-lysine N-methyltransferase [Burkholderiales bacterium]